MASEACVMRILALVLGVGVALATAAPVVANDVKPTVQIAMKHSAKMASGAVTISNFKFTPPALSVAVGTKVTWTNNGSMNHTTTSNTGVWDSGPLANGKTFSFTFTKAGTFPYHCSIHPNMKGTITVAAMKKAM